MLLWNAAYESSPGSNLSKALIDDTIRLLKVGIRERMEIEHYWEGDEGGKHIPGGTSVMDKGDATALSAITNMQDGALFLLEDGLDLRVQLFNTTWQSLSTLDHLSLSGTTNNDHPDLLLHTLGTTTGLDMGGNKITTSESTDYYGVFLLYDHKSSPAAHFGRVGNIAAIKDFSIGINELNVHQIEASLVLPALSAVNIPLGTGYFLPQIYVLGAFNANVYIAPAVSPEEGLSVVNKSGGAVGVRIRVEVLL